MCLYSMCIIYLCVVYKRVEDFDLLLCFCIVCAVINTITSKISILRFSLRSWTSIRIAVS